MSTTTRGHVRERGPNTWQVFLSAGFDPTGKRRRITRTVHGSRTAAEYLLWQLDVLDAEQRPDRPAVPLRGVDDGGPRWPLEPLLAALGGPSTRALAELLDVERREVYRWRARGLSDRAADRAAIAAGFHPAEVWGPQW